MAATGQAWSSPVGEKPRLPGEPEDRNPGNRSAENPNQDALWQPVLELPCLFTVELPLPNFKVADFLRLQSGSVIATVWGIARDVPLRVNGTVIGWGEFEGAGTRLAVRLTELA